MTIKQPKFTPFVVKSSKKAISPPHPIFPKIPSIKFMNTYVYIERNYNIFEREHMNEQSNSVPPAWQPPAEEEMDEELDDLDMPQLFHTSSLRERTDPELPVVSAEIEGVKKWVDPNGNDMVNQYQICEELGRGAFGSVFKVCKGDNFYALKVCNKMGLEKQRFFAADGEFANSMDVLNNQLNIIKRLSHKNIAKCYEILYGSDRIYSVNQLGTLGQIMLWVNEEEKYIRNVEVVDYIAKKYKTNNLSDITRIIFIEICEAIKYLHDHEITNRDIKVDNMLCSRTNDYGDEVKVIDFTTVRYRGTDDISYFPTGTPGFRGPEHLNAASDGYSCKAADIWSIGYSMYVFYHQKMAFYAETEYDMDLKTNEVELVFDESCPTVLVDVISKMTRKDWKQRINIDQTLELLKQN